MVGLGVMALLSVDAVRAWGFAQRGEYQLKGWDPVLLLSQWRVGLLNLWLLHISRQVEWEERVKHLEEMEKERIAEMDQHRNEAGRKGPFGSVLGRSKCYAKEKGNEHLAGTCRQPVGIQWDG